MTTKAQKKQKTRLDKREERALRKELMNLERTVKKLSKEKDELNGLLMTTTDVDEALKLHGKFERVTAELDSSESRWLEVHEELEA